MGLRVHRPARRDERGDVGDRVADAVPGAAALDVERLVEVHRLGRVDGDERDRGLVRAGEARRAGGAHRVGDDLGREADGDVELTAQLGESRLDLGVVGVGQAEPALRHRSRVRRDRPDAGANAEEKVSD